jgi:hypothetical protein
LAILARNAAWYATHPDKSKLYNARWRAKNREYNKKRAAKWSKDNPDRCCIKRAARDALKIKATPSWAIGFFIEEAYRLAALRTKMLGYKWHVDHIVPLRSKLVCGLHVHNNLAVVPAVINIAKGNRHWPDMPS